MIISDATRASSISDKVFVLEPVVRFNVNVLDPLNSSDHNKISISFDLPVEYQYQYPSNFKHIYFSQEEVEDQLTKIKISKAIND